MAHRISRLFLLSILLLPSLAIGFSGKSVAAELKTVGDGTPASCSEAELDTALAGGGSITFQCGGEHTITLTSQKVIETATTLDGDDLITLSGGDTTSLFRVVAGAELVLDDIVLTDGSAVRHGGAIENYGRLALHNTRVQRSRLTLQGQDCERGSTCGGAGIYSHDGAVLELHDSRVISNTGGWYGGGIYSSGRLMLADSEVRDNQTQGTGGGLEANGASEISNTIISGNVATESFGGGIAIFTGTLTLVNSVVEHNAAGRLGGGLIVSSFANTPGDPGSNTNVEIRDTRIAGNSTGSAMNAHGGGVYVTGGARLAMTRVTVSQNSAGGSGGGLFSFQNDTGVYIAESTFSDNQALSSGGGIENQGQMLLATTMVMSNTLFGDITAPCIDTDTCGGGGVSNIDGTLELRETNVVGNDSKTFGGGIASNFGRLKIDNSLVQGNKSDSSGAGMYIRSPTTIDNTSIVGNNAGMSGDGGGIFVIAGPLTMRHSTIEDNTVLFNGGGMAITWPEPDSSPRTAVTIEASRISGNQAVNTDRYNRGGAILNFGGGLTLKRVTISGNQADDGGGVSSELGRAELRVSDSTFADNLAVNDQTSGGSGGAIFTNGGSALLENSTLSGNRATRRGGGLEAASGDVKLAFTTIAGNRAPEGANLSRIDATLSMSNTILADPRDGANCAAALALAGGDYNLASDQSCGLSGTGDLQNVDPLLGALAENGGPTMTHLPATGSPALDAAGSPCPAADQRGYARPAAATCDIGAVEHGAQAPEPTPTETPTETTVPEPTPTATVIPAGKPAAALVPADLPDGVKPTVALTSGHGYLGQEFTVLGDIPAGYEQVRLSVLVDGQTVGSTLVRAVNGQSYSAPIEIDQQFPVGEVMVCAAVTGEVNAENACTPFRVDAAPPSTVRGTIPVVPGVPINATMRLMDAAGATLYSTAISQDGSFTFENVAPGLYQYAAVGNLSTTISPGLTDIRPSYDKVLQLDTIGRCNFSAVATPATVAVQATPSRHAVDTTYWSRGTTDRGTAIREQIRPFGQYVSGVPNFVTFNAYPQVSGTAQSVIFELMDARGNPIPGTKTTVNGPPFVARLDVGRLPASINGQHPQLVVTPVVNGQAQCASTSPIEVIPNPLDRNLNPFIQPGAVVYWDGPGGAYRFDGIIPYVEGLLPAEENFELPVLGKLENRLNAGIQVKGYFNLEGKGRFTKMAVVAEATVISLSVFGPGDVKDIPVPNVEFNLNNMRDLSLPYDLGDLVEPFTFRLPYIKVPVLSFFGIVTLKVIAGGGVRAGVTLSGYVKPFLPGVKITLTGYGEGYVEFGVAIDALGGIVEGGATLQIGVRIGLPLGVTVDPGGYSIGFDDPCFDFLGRYRVYVETLYGLHTEEHIGKIFDTGRCPGKGLTASVPAQEPDPLARPGVSAAPSVAIDANGRGLSAYIENTAAAGSPPQNQVLARFKDADTGEWQAAVPISDVATDARTPVVAFVGPEATPLVAWVANVMTYEEAQTLPTGDLSAATRRQELFYSLWNGASWGEPIRLTDNDVPEGLPALEGSPDGAVLGWARDLDGDLATRADTRIAVSLFDPATGRFGEPDLLSGLSGGLNVDLDVAYDTNGEKPVPYVVWVNDADADLVTAGDRRIALAYMPDTDWVLLNPQPLPPRVDSPAIAVGPEGVQLAFLVRDPDPGADDPEPALIGPNGKLWTARLTGDEWVAQPVQDQTGGPVFAERPVLDTFRNETLLLFRQFGDAGTNAAIGQLSLSRIVAAEPPTPPLYITDEPRQNWYQDMALDPRTGRAEILKVTASFGGITPGLTGSQALPAAAKIRLSAGADSVSALSVKTGADPALDPLEVDTLAPAPDELVTVKATVRNVGRGIADDMTLRLYAGTAGQGTLLRTMAVPGSLDFNATRTVSMRIPATAGEYPLYAEVSGGENQSTANDRATVTLGRLSAPSVGTLVESATYVGAFALTWPQQSNEYITGYRVLRSPTPDGTYELVGETSQVAFTDTLVEREVQYCYRVQSYNPAGVLSPLSEPWCGALPEVRGPLFLPVIAR